MVNTIGNSLGANTMNDMNVIFNKLGSLETSVTEIRDIKVDIKEIKDSISKLQSDLNFIYQDNNARRDKKVLDSRWALVIIAAVNGIMSTLISLTVYYLR